MKFDNMYIKRQDIVDNVSDNSMDDTAWVAIAFMALFLAAAIITLSKIIRYRKDTKNPIGVVFLFMPAPIIEAIGFGLRVLATRNPTNRGPYIASMVLLGTAPVFLTTASWLVFPALVHHAGAEYSWMRPRTMGANSFIWSITAFQLIIRGLITAYVEANNGSYVGDGGGIMLGGTGLVLSIEIVSAILFAIFIRRFFAVNSVRENRRTAHICVVVAICIIAISMRNIYRIVEFALLIANAGHNVINEIWLYIFDVAPTFIAIMALAIVHPYDISYTAVFCKKTQDGGRCVRTNTERQREVPADQAVPPPSLAPPSYRSNSVSTVNDDKAPIKVYDHLQDNIKYYERE